MKTALPVVAEGPSIYEYIRRRLDPSGVLPDAGMDLPDETVSEDRIRWSAGAFDGVGGHHSGRASGAAHARLVAKNLAAAARRPSRRRLARLYRSVADQDALDFVDPMLEVLAGLSVNVDAAHRLGLWLATTGSQRGAVKVGLALLGVTRVQESLAVVRTLGAHEEFTLYAAVALRNGSTDLERQVWELAKSVHGWGRIECVDRLRDTSDPEIQAWILREGFRNSVMYEYLAYTAATTGDLVGALRLGDDRELLTAAGEIISAMLVGGPAEGIDDYESGPEALSLFVERMEEHAETLGDLMAIGSMLHFLDETDGPLPEKGWNPEQAADLRTRCVEMLARPHWPGLIDESLGSSDRMIAFSAGQAARTLGIDTFEVQIRKIAEDPLGGPWYDAWRQADEERAERLVDLARSRLPLEQIATGPGTALGFGPEWAPHSALDWTLQRLDSFPGVGRDLIQVAMRSPVVGHRYKALQTLRAWPVDAWPNNGTEILEVAAQGDPDEGVRSLAVDVLEAVAR